MLFALVFCIGLAAATSEQLPQFHCQNSEGTPTNVPTSWKCNIESECIGDVDEADCEPLFDCQPVHHPGQELIPMSWVCNNLLDCMFGTDEDNCDEYFICGSGESIPKGFECDHYIDCQDGSDEAPINSNVKCGKFQCPSGPSIFLSQQCNGIADCPGEEDEENCPYLTCDGGEKAVSLVELCDDKQDCLDGSDVNSDLCPFYTCQGGRGIVIAKSWLCDLYPDCPQKEDESYCDHHRCGQHQVPTGVLCDGHNDCTNNADELFQFCQLPTEQQFLCELEPSDKPVERKGIPFAAVCDGESDCPNGDDEQEHNCLFECDLLLYAEFRCDGAEQCFDGSDELFCHEK